MDAFSAQSPRISLSDGITLFDIYERQSCLNSFLISFFDFELTVVTADTRAAGVDEEDELVAVADAADEDEGAEDASRRSRGKLSALDDPDSRVT
jgi:hypothetical protein